MGSIKSSKPKKQRKQLYLRPLHKKQAGLKGHLSKRLREQLGRRSLSLRKGDVVRVMRGSKKGSEGKIIGVNYKKGTVSVDKLTRKKADGTEIPLRIKACNMLIVDVDRSDARRFKGKLKKAAAIEQEEKQAGKEIEGKKEKTGKKTEKRGKIAEKKLGKEKKREKEQERKQL